jgi:glucan phosphoethanolaminetransferase (alkaline phosphatase superfamily)
MILGTLVLSLMVGAGGFGLSYAEMARNAIFVLSTVFLPAIFLYIGDRWIINRALISRKMNKQSIKQEADDSANSDDDDDEDDDEDDEDDDEDDEDDDEDDER